MFKFELDKVTHISRTSHMDMILKYVGVGYIRIVHSVNLSETITMMISNTTNKILLTSSGDDAQELFSTLLAVESISSTINSLPRKSRLFGLTAKGFQKYIRSHLIIPINKRGTVKYRRINTMSKNTRSENV